MSAGAGASPLEAVFARARDGDVDGAVGDLTRRLATSPEDAEAWLTLGMVLADAQRWGDALAPLQRATALDGAAPLARVLLARSLEREGRLDEAEAELDAASRLAPSSPGILRESASLAYARGRHDDALARLERAAALSAPPAEAGRIGFARGLVHEARGDLGAAIAAYRDAVTHDPRHAVARRALAGALAQVGEHARAIEALDALLVQLPADEAAAHDRAVLVAALDEMHAGRLLGKPAAAVAACALVERAPLRPAAGTAPDEARWVSAESLLQASLDSRGRIIALFFAVTDAALAERASGAAFEVTVLTDAGDRAAPSFTTAASVTFLREALGIPMTQAAGIFARLLSDAASLEVGGATVAFASLGDRHGLRVSLGP